MPNQKNDFQTTGLITESPIVQETINQRRKELVEVLKTGVASLFNLLEQNDSDEQKKSTQFSTNMCLSELYRSIAYWESNLYDVSTTIQKSLNNTENANDPSITTE